MKNRLPLLWIIVVILLALPGSTFAQTSTLASTFTYQGYLTNASGVVNATCDLQFSLFNGAAAGTQIGSTLTKTNVSVSNGAFSVLLDFGATAFDGTDRYLQIGVRCPAGSGVYSPLSPRQPLTPAPYTLFAEKAPWTGLSGVPGGLTAFGDLACTNGQIPKWNGTTWICAADNGAVGAFWGLTGNSGTTAGTNFIGTTDNQPLEFRINNLRGLRLEPNATSPNIIGGFNGNNVTAGVFGATIGGGGEINKLNSVADNYGVVSGGLNNRAGNGTGTVADAGFATVSGGYINTASGNFSSVGGGYTNTASADTATVGGGYNNNVNAAHATVGGGQSNLASGDSAAVGGGSGNSASGFAATVGGGDTNSASGSRAIVGGGRTNTASDFYATVGGGFNNTASNYSATVGGGYNNSASTNSYTTVAGGYSNTASGSVAMVGGGYNNIASGDYTTVGGGNSNATVGGDGNTASGNSATAAGGYSNTASGYSATVAGGEGNTASGNDATVGGGFSNTANNYRATVSGGYTNRASGDSATVGGGYSNIASGLAATVPGGYGNNATGAYSFAAGRNAYASNDGTFTWADSTGLNFGSNINNIFLARASGGVYFYTNPGSTIGVGLPSGSGTWSQVSDRNMKANFVSVDPLEVLQAVVNMPVSSWNYITQDSSIRHIGPMAQDFYASFGVGEDDTHISTIDSEGVALAAIQGLYQQVQDKDAQITALQTRLDTVESRLAAIEQSSGTAPASGVNTHDAALLVVGLVVVGGTWSRRRRTDRHE